jgi:hypothetical protein
MRQPYIADGEWSRWVVECSEPSPAFQMVTWQLSRRYASGGQLIVARGCEPTTAECKIAGGQVYRRMRRAATWGFRGYI